MVMIFIISLWHFYLWHFYLWQFYLWHFYLLTFYLRTILPMVFLPLTYFTWYQYRKLSGWFDDRISITNIVPFIHLDVSYKRELSGIAECIFIIIIQYMYVIKDGYSFKKHSFFDIGLYRRPSGGGVHLWRSDADQVMVLRHSAA